MVDTAVSVSVWMNGWMSGNSVKRFGWQLVRKAQYKCSPFTHAHAPVQKKAIGIIILRACLYITTFKRRGWICCVLVASGPGIVYMEDKSWFSEHAATFQAGLNRRGSVLPLTETVKQASHACTLQISLLIYRHRKKYQIKCNRWPTCSRSVRRFRWFWGVHQGCWVGSKCTVALCATRMTF